MPEGAMMSTPALAWAIAVFCQQFQGGIVQDSTAQVAYFQVAAVTVGVYSQRQVSAITIKSGTADLTAVAAFWTIPQSCHAPVASTSYRGNAKRIMAGMPKS
jgi:hypothetical protein